MAGEGGLHRFRLAERAPHPEQAQSALVPTSPRKRGEVKCRRRINFIRTNGRQKSVGGGFAPPPNNQTARPQFAVREGVEAELILTPRRRSYAILSALSSSALGGTYDWEPVSSSPSAFRCPRSDASPLVSVRLFNSSGTSCSTSMSGTMPLAWIERPDGGK